MKHILFFICIALLPVQAFSQTSEPASPAVPTVDELMNVWTLLTSGLITFFTYLSGMFPNLTIFKNDKKRDLGIKAIIAAIVVGVVMVAVGPVSALQVVIAFCVAVLSYDKLLKPVGLATKTKAGEKSAEE